MANITAITLGSKDLVKATAFYKALGYKPGFVSKEVVFFQLNSAVLSLYRQDMLSADLKTPKSKAPRPGGITLAINVASKKDVDRLFAKANKNGAKTLRAPHEAVWGGYTAYFADRDGHAWEVAWNPFWKLDKKGNIKL